MKIRKIRNAGKIEITQQLGLAHRKSVTRHLYFRGKRYDGLSYAEDEPTAAELLKRPAPFVKR